MTSTSAISIKSGALFSRGEWTKWKLLAKGNYLPISLGVNDAELFLQHSLLRKSMREVKHPRYRGASEAHKILGTDGCQFWIDIKTVCGGPRAELCIISNVIFLTSSLSFANDNLFLQNILITWAEVYQNIIIGMCYAGCGWLMETKVHSCTICDLDFNLLLNCC